MTSTNPIYPRLALLFTGQGSQRPGAGASLYAALPSFRQDIDQCDAILRPYLQRSLPQLLFSPETTSIELAQTRYTQPALFSLGYALAKLWQRWELPFHAALGHSLGEYIAACLCGVFSLQDALILVARRAALMHALPQDGEMLVVFADAATTEAIRDPFRETVSIAAYNAPKNTVLSGKKTDIQTIRTQLEQQNIGHVGLMVSHAFHSPLMRPIIPPFTEIALRIPYHPPHTTLIANRTGTPAGSAIANAAYWRMHILEPVHFLQSIQTLCRSEYTAFLEIGPRPTLLKLTQQSATSYTTHCFATLDPKQSTAHSLRSTAQSLVSLGFPLDTERIEHDLQQIAPYDT